MAYFCFLFVGCSLLRLFFALAVLMLFRDWIAIALFVDSVLAYSQFWLWHLI